MDRWPPIQFPVLGIVLWLWVGKLFLLLLLFYHGNARRYIREAVALTKLNGKSMTGWGHSPPVNKNY
jgi:hypothetical protein